MHSELLALAAALSARGEPYVLATVVRRDAPSSAHTGDAALITADGTFRGWVGGSCTRPLVVREALRALADGGPRLINISGEPEAQRRPGLDTLEMTCHSGGMVEVFIQPVLPAPLLVVFGASPIARAVVRIGRAMGYRTHLVDPAAEEAALRQVDQVSAALEDGAVPPGAYLVVATIGEWDADAVETALRLEPAYLGVVASRRRFAHVRQALETRGVSRAALDRVRSPAGLDIGARTPEEVALSIMAEIVELRRRTAPAAGDHGTAQAQPSLEAPAEVRDPVCGMMVATAGARYRADVDGTAYYFCCGGCRDRFLADPGRYVSSAAGASDA